MLFTVQMEVRNTKKLATGEEILHKYSGLKVLISHSD